MNVKELIEYLKKLNQDAEVVVSDNDCFRFNTAIGIRNLKIVKKNRQVYVSGVHHPNSTLIDAVWITDMVGFD